MKKKLTRLFSVLLAAVLVLGTLPVSAMGTDVADPPASAVDDTPAEVSAAEPEEASVVDETPNGEEAQSGEVEAATVESTKAPALEDKPYNIFFLDCGRKYYSVDSIKQLIDNASAAGFNYIQLAVGNDGLRFLLDDMSLTVNGTTYDSTKVSSAIHAGNEAYYNFDVDELTQSDMDTIIAYANDKGMGVIPCVNSPGHMDAILSAANSLTGTTCSYNGSVRTIDVTNSTAVAFTQALLQKYITYFAGKGCQLFNMGADEYANDKYTGGSMGFGNLQSEGNYSYYVTYVNKVAAMIKKAGMTPMAFNDGIYFNNDTNSGNIDTDIVVCYWSSGWGGYTPMPASTLASKGFKLINTNGAYYWVLGKSDTQCDETKASGFDRTAFPGDATIENPLGSMFCIWADYPGAETEASVITKTAATIAAFGATLPKDEIVISDAANNGGQLETGKTMVLTANKKVDWTTNNPSVASIAASDTGAVMAAAETGAVNATAITVTAVEPGNATITAAAGGKTATYNVTVNAPGTKNVTVTVNGTKTIPVDENTTVDATNTDTSLVEITQGVSDGEPELKAVSQIKSGKQYLIESYSGKLLLTAQNTNSMLVLNGTAKANSKELWEMSGSMSGSTFTGTVASAGSYNKNAYLSIGNGSASMSDAEQLELVYYSDSSDSNGGYWTIAQNLTTSTWYGTTTTTTYYLNQYGGADKKVAAGWTVGEKDTGSRWYIYEVTTSKTANVTIKGLKEGNTSVVIGGTTYNIFVKPESLAEVTPLTIEYWITNETVTADTATTLKVQATATGINSESGVKLSTLVPGNGYRTSDTNKKEVVFWKGTRLSSDKKQTRTPGDDKTRSGNDFYYIRYWNGNWAFSRDGTTWTNFNTDDQVVAYYLQRTDVTNEVITDVVDWGEERSTYPYSTFVLLDFAVKYGSGDRVPDSFPVANKTITFHCDPSDTNTVHQETVNNQSVNYRTIGSIRATESKDYEVYMITVTPNSDDKTLSGQTASSATSSTSYTYSGTEKVIWVDKEEDLTDEFKDESLHADGYSVGGEAVVPSLNIYSRHAMLVTYYVREKTNPGALTVNYVDLSDNTQFYTYNINVANENMTFDSGIELNDPWKGDLKNATITNIAGKQQTVSAKLSTMPAVPVKYRRAAEYTCVSAVRSADGKTVTLYYTFNYNSAFVVDFGTPLTITKEQVSENLRSARITSVEFNNVTCGTASAAADGTITYTPNKDFVKSAYGETFEVVYTGTYEVEENGEKKTQTGSVAYSITVYPASNVLYEENFLTGADGWDEVKAEHTKPQETQKVGDSDKNVFGNDASYAGDTNNTPITGQNGAWTIDGLSTSEASSALTTSFYGNTFDLIGNCSPTTGRVMALISEDGANRVRIVDIDTRYNDGTIYQVPLAHEKLSDDDRTYSVKIYASGLAAKTVTATTPNGVATMSLDDASAETDDLLAQVLEENGLSMDDVEYVSVSAMDNVNTTATVDVPGDAVATYVNDSNEIPFQAGTHVEINGFRVYRSTTDEMAQKNYPESEKSMKYWNIIDVMHGQTITAYRDNKSGHYESISIDAYENDGGPQNEIYLTHGQSIAFAIDGVKSVQVSLRSVEEETATEWNHTTITSNTELYYTITKDDNGNFLITNTGAGILGIGNVKIPNSKTENDITTPSEMDQNKLERSILAVLNGDTEEPEVFTPETFTAKTTVTPVVRNKMVTLKVNVSSDVAYITVNGVKYTRTGLQGLFQKTRTIRVVNTVKKGQTKTYEVVAYNADGVASETITVTG